MWHDQMWDGHLMMSWGFIPMLIFWGLMLFLFFYIIKTVFGSGSKQIDNNRQGDSSLTILKERLARGEIDEAEFNTLYEKLRHVS